MIATAQKYKLWPFVKLKDDTYSIPDIGLQQIWQKIVEDQREKIVFYGGEIRGLEAFLKYLKEPLNHVVFVVDIDKKEFVFMAWLNGIQRTSAFCHFCGIGKNTYRPEIGQMVLDYWKTTGVSMVAIGIIPEINETAIKLTKELGFVDLGIVPHLCYFAETRQTVGGRILFYNFKEEVQNG